MLIQIKPKDEIRIESYIKLSNLFLREFYMNIVSYDLMPDILYFNNPETISREIKEKVFMYYIIRHESQDIGEVSLKIVEGMLNISQIFLLKRFRKLHFTNKIIEELKNIAQENSLEALRITLPEENKKLPNIVKKWGFQKNGAIARYLGDMVYIFEDVYTLGVHVK